MLGHFYFAKKNNKILITNETGCFSFLNPEELHAFIHDSMDHNSQKWQELSSKYFCNDDSEETFVRNTENAIRNGDVYLFEPTSLFIFAVTNACNNRCLYCQANGQRKICHMDIQTAEAALLKIAEAPASNITIEFQGGEPLMNYPVIKHIVTKGKEILSCKTVQYTLVSNLSLLTDEMAAFFAENNVSVSTSLDGPESLHNLNRPAADNSNSFGAMIKGKKILEKYGITAGAIETTTAHSLSMPDEIIETYVQNGFHQIFLRPLSKLGAAARNWEQIGYTPEQFLEFYDNCLKKIIRLNRDNIPIVEYHATLFLKKILTGRTVNYMELRSPCGAGLGQMAITANGNVYTCDEGRMLAEIGDEAFLLGNVFTDGYNEWIDSGTCKAVCSASLLDTLPGCCDCVYKPYCGVCPVINYALNGNVTIVAKDRCKIYTGILDILFQYLDECDPEIMDIFSTWVN